MLDKLNDLIHNTPPKQLSQVIKKDTDLYNEIKKCYGNSIAEQTYNFINKDVNYICEHQHTKKFKNLKDGYGFCGPTSKCKCAKEQIGKKVSLAKSNYSDSQKEKIQSKRKSTVLSKYGVDNVGQTTTAKQKHLQFYNNTAQVDKVTEKIKKTKKQKYGNENYNNAEKIKQTWRSFSVDYFVEKYDNENLILLQDKEYLTNLYNKHSIYDIAEMLDVHIQTIYRYLNKYNIREPFKSSEENEIAYFIESLGITNIVRNSRKILDSKKEIDIFLPAYNIAIEYNGVYWHHEDIDHITRSYHYDKYKECENKGIQLITIFSNFWKTKKDIVKNILINKLNLSKESVYARKCKIIQLSAAESKHILTTNHIQGYTPASIIYGLTYNDEICAVMSFGKPRIGIGNYNKGYELIRFVSTRRVIGGASKLLKHFITHNNPTSIISYSDNEWSDGNLYNQLGFNLEKEIPPSYWYLKPREERLYHRFNFSKQKLIKQGFDSNLTEKQITKQMGLLKVWDCGKKRWVINFK